MKFLLSLTALTLILAAGSAAAQSASDTTTQTSVPAPGTLATTHESHAVDAYGNRTDSRATSYSNGTGVARDSTTTTTTVAPPPPPPVSTTTSSSTTTTTTAPN